jgi:type II secretory pathway pseudopilin PulG
VNRSSRSTFRPSSRRRGVTLVEMLVTVAILIIIMTILVQVFQAATGAVSAAQAIAQLDDQFRRVDGLIRADLLGATSRFTPAPINNPLSGQGLDPTLGLGYFEYGENEFADSQGEDSDDYIRFTAKAPPGQPFTGRMWINPWLNTATNPNTYWPTSNSTNTNPQPVTITSNLAEIIYFVRNGNLYRRVLLVAPELQSTIAPTVNNNAYLANLTINTAVPFQTAILGPTNNVSWQGVNDLSARPAPTGPNLNNISVGTTAQAQQTILLNTLGSLTNRENRFANPRFSNDYTTFVAAGGTPTNIPDGLPDDNNSDSLPDVYPTFYPGLFAPINGPNLLFPPPGPNGYSLPNANNVLPLLAFPYVYPGAYTRAQTLTSNPPNSLGYACGWIHSPDPQVLVNNNTYEFDTNALLYLQNINHNPLDTGDNLNTPPPNTAGYVQTWWGFPTSRETLSPFWNDPTWQLNVNLSQPNALTPLTNGEITSGHVGARYLPPPMTSLWRINPQLSNDGLPDNGASGTVNLFPSNAAGSLWASSWEDDLIMTGVRSFDVKAYDNLFGGYVDLGWGDDVRITGGQTYLNQTPLTTTWPPSTGPTVPTYTSTFAHEGRIPPLVNDNRFDSQYGPGTYPSPPGNTYTGNIGDNNAGLVRLRRVWDSWSTDYGIAPGTAFNSVTGFMVGPPNQTPPVYPSYPAPYPAPLRAIQIQIRIVDPTNQRVKSLTIIQDFTDKL